jgi:pyruvate/2-oxoglutarate dehydrogenase complex dihydrolipoamide acyltransferase (E2) component
MVSRITIDQDKHADAKLRVEREPEEYQAPQVPQQAPQQAAPEPDPKAQAWAERNDWFGNDDTMTYAAFGIHRRLVEEEGFDPTSDEYYTELDKRIKGDFPQRFGQPVQPTKEEPKKAAKPRVASAESTASRSSTKGRRTVKLSQSQVAIAKKLGVPLEEYAKFVKE